MPLIQLEFRNIRIYEHARINPDPRLTLISGANAGGKTTLLEAIHVLSTGRSFRTSQIEQLRRHGTAELSVVGQYQPNTHQAPIHCGIVYEEQGRRISLNGAKNPKISDLAQQLPLLVISPDSHFEFQQTARHRRAVLDWVLFHVKPGYQDTWNRYQRSLQQRNAALKEPKQAKVRFSWDEELAVLGDSIQAQRQAQLAELVPVFQSICRELLSIPASTELLLEAGWEDTKGMAECLLEDRNRDQARGSTHSGPHRNDLRILLDRQPSREEASHGQNKLLVIALRVAQIQHLYESTGRECCLLIDDLAAELDAEHRQRLARHLSKLPVQVFVTATDASQIDIGSWPSHAWFHVEHGMIQAR